MHIFSDHLNIFLSYISFTQKTCHKHHKRFLKIHIFMSANWLIKIIQTHSINHRHRVYCLFNLLSTILKSTISFNDSQ